MGQQCMFSVHSTCDKGTSVWWMCADLCAPAVHVNVYLHTQVFNTRKMSPVFTPGAESDVPPVFVDRFGAKAWTSHTGAQHRGAVDTH